MRKRVGHGRSGKNVGHVCPCHEGHVTVSLILQPDSKSQVSTGSEGKVIGRCKIDRSQCPDGRQIQIVPGRKRHIAASQTEWDSFPEGNDVISIRGSASEH